MAPRTGRLRGPAGRRDRNRLVGDPVDPRDRANPAEPPDRVPAHAEFQRARPTTSPLDPRLRRRGETATTREHRHLYRHGLVLRLRRSRGRRPGSSSPAASSPRSTSSDARFGRDLRRELARWAARSSCAPPPDVLVTDEAANASPRGLRPSQDPRRSSTIRETAEDAHARAATRSGRSGSASTPTTTPPSTDRTCDLVDLQRDPHRADRRRTGIRLRPAASDGDGETESPFVGLDTLVLATGFDAMTGALDRIDDARA